MQKPTILLVEDDFLIREGFVLTVEEEMPHIQLETAGTWEEAKIRLNRSLTDSDASLAGVITDWSFPNERGQRPYHNGIKVLEWCWANQPNLPVVVHSAELVSDIQAMCVHLIPPLPSEAIFTKPVSVERVLLYLLVRAGLQA